MTTRLEDNVGASVRADYTLRVINAAVAQRRRTTAVYRHQRPANQHVARQLAVERQGEQVVPDTNGFNFWVSVTGTYLTSTLW